jgi:hypothetical protein
MISSRGRLPCRLELAIGGRKGNGKGTEREFNVDGDMVTTCKRMCLSTILLLGMILGSLGSKTVSMQMDSASR